MANLQIGAAVTGEIDRGHSTRNAAGRGDGNVLEISERLPIGNILSGADDLNLAYLCTGRIAGHISHGRSGLRARADVPAELAKLRQVITGALSK